MPHDYQADIERPLPVPEWHKHLRLNSGFTEDIAEDCPKFNPYDPQHMASVDTVFTMLGPNITDVRDRFAQLPLPKDMHDRMKNDLAQMLLTFQNLKTQLSTYTL